MKLKIEEMIDLIFQAIGIVTVTVFILIGIFGGGVQVKINFNSIVKLFKNL